MGPGKIRVSGQSLMPPSPAQSPIVRAIADAEQGTSGRIRVHVTKKWIDSNPIARARNIFNREAELGRQELAAVLLYINLRKRVFVIISNIKGEPFLSNLACILSENMRSTQSERAIALTVKVIGEILKERLPNS